MDHAVLTEDNADTMLAQAVDQIKNKKLPYTILVKKGLFDERH